MLKICKIAVKMLKKNRASGSISYLRLSKLKYTHANAGNSISKQFFTHKGIFPRNEKGGGRKVSFRSSPPKITQIS